MISFTIITPTIGRKSLRRAGESLLPAGMDAADRWFVVADGEEAYKKSLSVLYSVYLPVTAGYTPKTGHWGTEQRNHAIKYARGSHLLFLDDDDIFVPGALTTIRGIVEQNPEKIHLFRFRYGPNPEGFCLWHTRAVVEANVGTPNLCIPNIPERLGTWTPKYTGDFDFLKECIAKHPARENSISWREEIVQEVTPGSDRREPQSAVSRDTREMPQRG